MHPVRVQAAALLVVHWLGDSLDGTLARVRKAERPTYGYYLGVQMRVSAHGMLGIAALSARTLREATQLTVRFAPILTTASKLHSETVGEESSLVFEEAELVGMLSMRDIIRVWTTEGATSGMSPG